MWAATLGVALTVAVVGSLHGPVRDLLRLHLDPKRTPTPSSGHIASLAAHNIPVAAWPLLLGLVNAHRHQFGRRVADTVLVACIAVNAMQVGAALGAYGLALLPYIPQLPLEWAGLALGATAWLLRRRQPLLARQWLVLATLTGAVLLCAATVETLAVPHAKSQGGP